jgi:hypothetical protein
MTASRSTTKNDNDPNRNGGSAGDPPPTGANWDPTGKLDHLRNGGR